MNTILNYYALSNTDYLHPKGKKATSFLLKILDCQPNENILEIGFGTGATIVFAATVYKKTNFYGIELNELMFEKALSRIAFCNVKKIHLKLNKNITKTSFADNFFDKIYAESVIAIQEGENLELLIKEIYRILKPNGKLVFNEGIWINSFSISEIRKMNDFCKFKFGIIQANEKYPYIDDWKNLLEKNNFTIRAILNLDEIENLNKIKHPFLNNLISKAFTIKGKIASKIKLSNWKQDLAYKKDISSIGERVKIKYLQGYLIDCKKKIN